MIVVGATTLDNHLFLSAANVQQILAGSAIIALLAIGETIVIITRNVDLSIGSILGISAYATGVLYVHHPGVALPVVFLLALAIGAACGVVNGLIVTVGRVPSLVVTLGTLYIIRGIDGAWAGGNQVNASMLPDSFNKIGYATVLGIPYLGWIAIIAVAVATYSMRSFRTARDFYAIGSDPGRGAPRRHPGRIPRLPRLRAERRDRRRHRGAVAVVVRVGRCDRRRRLRVPGHRGGRRGRRGDLRRERHRPRRGARGAPPLHDQQRAGRRERLLVLEHGARGGVAAGRHRVRPAHRAAGRPRHAHTKESSWLTSRASSPARRPRATPVAASSACSSAWETLLVVLLLASIAYGASVSPYFLDSTTLFFIGLNVGEIAIIALPLTLIIITG